jgi:hypothetical protein
LIRLAVFAGQICANLRTNTDTVADFNGLHILANFDRFADDFVAHADGKRTITPSTIDGMDVRAADTTAVYGNVDVAVFELLELELRDGVISC